MAGSSSLLSRTEPLTSPTEVNAVTKLISVGTVSNFPAWWTQRGCGNEQICPFLQRQFNNDQHDQTHISSDHNVEADGKRFVKLPIFSPVVCLEIFGKSALKGNERRSRFSETGPQIDRRWAVPEVVAFGDVVLGEGRVESCERIPRNAQFNIPVQVTLPLNVYSYFSSLSQKNNNKPL